MYLPAANTVVALEADTGKVVWQREVAGAGPGGGLNRRGVAYWPGDRNTPDRIFVTAGRRLLSSMPRPASRLRDSARTAKSTW